MIEAILSAFLLAAQLHGPAPKPVCWPLHFAGLTVGISTDSEMVRLLGKGVFRPRDGDLGGRIFIDSKQTATLHAQFYTDHVIGDLTVEQGVKGLTPAERRRAVSRYFDPDEGFGSGLRLGATRDEVRSTLGPPESGEGTDEWEYSTICVCELPESFTLTFRHGRIVKVVFSAPSG